MRRVQGLIRALWAGEVPLARAFWEFAIVGGFLVNLVTTILLMTLLTADASLAWLIVAFCLPLPYNLLMFVAVWRSAGQYQGRPLWADLARTAIVVWTIAATIL